MPVGWQQKQMNEVRRFLDVKFARKDDPNVIFLFGATDLWSEYTSEEQKWVSRSEMNDDYYNKETIQEAIGISPAPFIIDEYFGGTHYYKAEWKESNVIDGNKIDVYMTAYMHFQNGWSYFFELGSVERDSYETDIQKIMRSVIYNGNKEQSTIEKNSFPYVVCFFIVLIIVGIAVCLIIIKKSGPRNHKPREHNKGQNGLCCPFCMTKIPVESVFCPVCGKQIKKGD
jgi:hypothetical protein